MIGQNQSVIGGRSVIAKKKVLKEQINNYAGMSTLEILEIE